MSQNKRPMNKAYGNVVGVTDVPGAYQPLSSPGGSSAAGVKLDLEFTARAYGGGICKHFVQESFPVEAVVWFKDP